MARKFVFYLREVGRTVVMTDTDDKKNKTEISKEISEIMSDFKVSKFETSSDTLIVRASDIMAVHIIDYYTNSGKEIKRSEENDDKKINLQKLIPSDMDIDLSGLPPEREKVKLDLEELEESIIDEDFEEENIEEIELEESTVNKKDKNTEENEEEVDEDIE